MDSLRVLTSVTSWRPLAREPEVPRRRGGSVPGMDVVLIPGLWLKGSVWRAVLGPLEERGHRGVPVTLPGQGDGRRSATLDDQVAAVLAAVDAAAGHPLVVGHSAASTLAWIAADARPQKVRKVAMIGGFPSGDGSPYFAGLDPRDGAVWFPGWEAFDGPDSADLDEDTKHRIAADAIPVPEAVTTGIVRLRDERRFDVPVTLICPEFSPDQAREWLASGQLPELPRVHTLAYVDIDSGHWPMFTQPDELARLIAEIAGA